MVIAFIVPLLSIRAVFDQLLRHERDRTDDDEEDDRLRGGIPHVGVGAERAVVDDEHGRDRRVRGAAVGHHEDLVVQLEGADDAHRDDE